MEGTEALERSLSVVSEGQRVKPRLLAWWCLLPISGWLAVEIPFGWSEAMRHVSVPADTVSFSVGFSVGRILGSALIALAVAWIAYRVGRRSTRAASIAFTLTLAVHCLAVLVMRETPTSFGEFAFEVPQGWVRVRPNRARCKAIILSSDTDRSSSPNMLMVDVGRPRAATLREFVDDFQDIGGSPPEAIQIDGVEGFVVETSSADLTRPHWIAAVFRDEQAYLVTAAGENTPEITSAFGQVVKTWKWR